MPQLVTDKETVMAISREIAQLLPTHEMQPDNVQINLLDRESTKDGRFLSYSGDYARFIKTHGHNLTGNADLGGLIETDNRFGVLESAAFNFRFVRNGYLMAHSYFPDATRTLREFRKAISKTQSLPRRLKALQIFREEGDARYDVLADFLATSSKQDAVALMPEIVGPVDLSFFTDARSMYLPPDTRTMLSNWARALTTFEELIQGFIKNNPPIELEVKTVL